MVGEADEGPALGLRGATLGLLMGTADSGAEEVLDDKGLLLGEDGTYVGLGLVEGLVDGLEEGLVEGAEVEGLDVGVEEGLELGAA